MNILKDIYATDLKIFFIPFPIITNMKVSIVIPTLNEEKYLGKCIESIKKQKLPEDIELEIVVVDSGSNDRTLEIARKYTNKVFSSHGGGIGENRQLGSEQATGEILISTDADCIYPEDWLAKGLKYFRDPDIICVSGPTIPIPEEAVFLDKLFYFVANCILKIWNDLFHRALFRGSNAFYRRWAFDKVGGYNIKLWAREDSELTGRMSKLGKKTVFDFGVFVMTSMRRRRARGWLRTIRYYIDTPVAMVTGKQMYDRPDYNR